MPHISDQVQIFINKKQYSPVIGREPYFVDVSKNLVFFLTNGGSGHTIMHLVGIAGSVDTQFDVGSCLFAGNYDPSGGVGHFRRGYDYVNLVSPNIVEAIHADEKPETIELNLTTRNSRIVTK